jgi:SnoaL-like domain
MRHAEHVGGDASRVGRRGLIAGGAGLVLAGSTRTAHADDNDDDAAASGAIGRPVPADAYTAICQLKANYVTATDSLPLGGNEARALALYRSTYTADAESSAGYDVAAPDFVVHGPDELFETLRVGLASFSSSQHNVGVIHVALGRAPGSGKQLATITAHVLVTLVSKATMDITRLVATYHDEAERRKGRWQVTKSFAQYLATETATRVLPPAVV